MNADDREAIAEIINGNSAMVTLHHDVYDHRFPARMTHTDSIVTALADFMEQDATKHCRAEDQRLGRTRQTPCPDSHGFDKAAWIASVHKVTA